MTAARKQVIKKKNDTGFTLIEVIVASSILFIVAIIICQSFAMSSHLLLLAQTQRDAESQVGEVVNQLSIQPGRKLIVGGSIDITENKNGRADAVISNENCGGAPTYCDRLIVPDPAAAKAPDLPSDCTKWPCLYRTASLTQATPAGTIALFTRGWRINSRDDEREILSVTVAIFAHHPDGARASLLALRTTNITPR